MLPRLGEWSHPRATASIPFPFPSPFPRAKITREQGSDATPSKLAECLDRRYIEYPSAVDRNPHPLTFRLTRPCHLSSSMPLSEEQTVIQFHGHNDLQRWQPAPTPRIDRSRTKRWDDVTTEPKVDNGDNLGQQLVALRRLSPQLPRNWLWYLVEGVWLLLISEIRRVSRWMDTDTGWTEWPRREVLISTHHVTPACTLYLVSQGLLQQPAPNATFMLLYRKIQVGRDYPWTAISSP